MYKYVWPQITQGELSHHSILLLSSNSAARRAMHTYVNDKYPCSEGSLKASELCTVYGMCELYTLLAEIFNLCFLLAFLAYLGQR